MYNYFVSDFDKPLFKQCTKDISELQVGDEVTGKVNNVTHFGAFVDIGVGKNALVHVSKMHVKDDYGRPSRYQLQIGENILATVEKLDRSRGQIGITLVKVL